MALRLILVGAVAGLGLSLPSASRLQSWGDSTRNWAHARFAAWDAQMPADASAFVLVAAPTVPPSESAAPAPTPTPAADKAAPVPIIATELAAGLDVPTCPMNLEAPSATALDDSAFDVAQRDVLSAFAADALANERPSPRFEPIVLEDDADEGVALRLNREAEGLNLATAVKSFAPDRFEPMVVGDDLEPGMAFALNREAEGLNLGSFRNAPPEVWVGREVESPDSRGRLTQAVRLTREAVHAWASLLHGPAVVILSH